MVVNSVRMSRTDSMVSVTRSGILKRFDVKEGNVFAFHQCPGTLVIAMSSSDPRIDSLRHKYCPDSAFNAMAVTLPSKPMGDEVKEFINRQVMVVRVLGQSLSPDGSVQTSTDLYFEKSATSDWKLIKKHDLLIAH